MKTSKTGSFLIHTCIIILGVTFVISGFLKAIDPLGMGFKLRAYFTSWGIDVLAYSRQLFIPVLALCTFEFCIGINLLLGIRRKTTTLLALIFMSLVSLLTLYIYLFNPVPDCGCFGDAILLSHAQTLGKNLILLACAIVAFLFSRHTIRVISERNQWIIAICAILYIIGLTIYSVRHLPPLDFSPYKEGADLKAAFYGTETSMDDLALLNLAFYDDSGEDIVETLATDTSATFLLTIPEENSADDGNNDRINDLYDYCLDNGLQFYGVIAASDASFKSHWTDRTGATYPILYGDSEQLKSLVRSNPGLLMFRNGKIVKKWSQNDLPVFEQTDINGISTPQTSQPLRALWLLLAFLIPSTLAIIADRLWINRKFKKHYNFLNQLIRRKMRKKIVAGNWKMNKNLQEGVALAKELTATLEADAPNCGVVICTPFIHLAKVAEVINPELIGLGAQNCADKEKGAYTGEVSAEMVKSTGANFVILGHSERRAYYNETPEILKEKVKLALANDLQIIFCIGEVLEEREAGKQNEVVRAQLEGSLWELTQAEFKNIILAYEPVWAIGTGKTATAEQAQDMHAFIRNTIAEKFGQETADETTILYGGSCKPSNAKELFSKPDVDGGLIGGAALKVEDFKGIIDAWK